MDFDILVVLDDLQQDGIRIRVQIQSNATLQTCSNSSWSCRSVIHFPTCVCVCVCTDLNHDSGFLVCQEQHTLLLRWRFDKKFQKKTLFLHT